MSVRSGTCLDGRYRLSDRLAVGGMGEVWRGTDEVLGRSVAVKILRAELAEDDAFRKRFRAEARTAGGLPHNGIAAVFDYGETTVGPDGSSPSDTPVQGDGIAYLVMELVPGEALSSILARDGALGTERTLSIVGQAARALHAAHVRGVVHRDVKPANLMVTPDGRVKVTDFGIARPHDHEPLTMTGQVMGTAHYLAPELARGLDASPLSDVYALGVVAYECLAGHRPFDGDNQVLVATAHLSQQPPPLPGTIAPDVVRVVGAAMEKDPARRIPSAEAFAVALEKLLAHDPTALDGIGDDGHGLAAAAAPAPVPNVPPPPPTRPSAAPLGAAAAGVAAAGVAGAAGAAALGTQQAADAAARAAGAVGSAGAGRVGWMGETAQQPTLLGPQGGVGYGPGGPAGPGYPGGQGYPGGPTTPVRYDEPEGRRGAPIPIIVGAAIVGLIVLALVLLNLAMNRSSTVTPTPGVSTGVTSTGDAGPTTGPTPTGPTGSAGPSASHSRTTTPGKSSSRATSVPPSSVPPSSVPPSSVPPSSVPPSSVPPTTVPPTSVPPTSVPPTSGGSIPPSPTGSGAAAGGAGA